MAILHYLEHLTDADLDMLAAAAGVGREGLAGLRGDPEALDALLGHQSLFEALFGGGADDPVLRVSPFLAFAVLVHRAAADLEQASFVREWLGPRRSVPIFDVSGLREFLARAERRLVLAELLASYTKVASGSVWFRTAHGWRRRRYSELDPLRMAELLEVVPPTEHAHLYRRLGDVCLFLAGVFPEHVAGHPLSARQLDRLGRLLQGTGDTAPDELLAGAGGIHQLEWAGRRAYRRAAAALRPPAWRRAAGELAEHFGRARRILNFLTGRYLFPARTLWFEGPER